MMRDPTIAGNYNHLFRSIVGHDFSFEADDPKDKRSRALAGVLEQLTKQMRYLPQALFNLARASFMGATWGLIMPRRKLLRIGDGKPRWWTVVENVRDIDKRRFRISRIGQTPEQAGILAGAEPRDKRFDLQSRASNMAKAQGLSFSGETQTQEGWHWEFHRGPSFWWQPLSACAPVDRWIQHIPDTTERGLASGYPDADAIYFFFWAKQQIMRFGLQGLERWGQGFLYAKIKALRDSMAKGTGQGSAFQQTLNQIRTWRSDNFAVVDEDTTLELLDMPTTGNVQCLEWIKYFDAEIVKYILQALQPTGGADGAGGGYSSAKVEEGSTESTVAYLRSPLEETWTYTVAQYLVDHNQDNLADLKLDSMPASRIRLQGKEVRDVDVMIKALEFMQKAKLPVRRSDVYSALGLTQPNEDDDESSDTVTFPEPKLGIGQDLGGDMDMGEDSPVGEGGSAVGDRKNGTAKAAT